MRSTVVLEKEKERTHQSSVNINNLQEKEYYMKKSRSLGSRCLPWTLSIHAYCTETPSHFMTIHPNRKKIYLQLIKSVVCEQNMKKKKAILALSRGVALQIQAIFNTAVKCQYPHKDTQYGITKMLIASGRWLEKKHCII